MVSVIFYLSTAYQTDFRNGTKYNCKTQYLDYHVTLNTFLSQNVKKYFFRETMNCICSSKLHLSLRSILAAGALSSYMKARSELDHVISDLICTD